MEDLALATLMLGSILAGAYCLYQGTLMSTSQSLERKEGPIYPHALSLVGVCLIAIGLVVVPALFLPPSPISNAILAMSAAISITLMSATLIGEDTPLEKLHGMKSTIAVALVLVVLAVFATGAGNAGGENGVIPESVWNTLIGAAVMIAGLFTASQCIIVGVKAGSDMLKENESLSIWALLFIALGEGLAIYGLIVAILILGG